MSLSCSFALVLVCFEGFVMEMRQTSSRDEVSRLYFIFPGCGEHTRRPGLSKGGTGLSLTIHHHGMRPQHKERHITTAKLQVVPH